MFRYFMEPLKARRVFFLLFFLLFFKLKFQWFLIRIIILKISLLLHALRLNLWTCCLDVLFLLNFLIELVIELAILSFIDQVILLWGS